MWNSGIPYVLKQWIDNVTQPGWAFGFDPERGYTGHHRQESCRRLHQWCLFAWGPHQLRVRFPSTNNGDAEKAAPLKSAEDAGRHF
ncbi:NAD(P)H-dependent oxidoreductase [Candidatus Mycobacterium methanotrophicum]|uniref:NAD(P)H-dependent oxidoreductase n=1 Tax=Candidatus Mycobacterium methanotrophicum TaxID=2943498 RepID=A0ABY4QTZ0_9MYCO|nr:NAD(P)H-dependent oxidoreductase [Candidatus Mycobacterium methanotrophicum]UQX13255.1 NAD(P)H-dependent oxidoreductase [Candidatus Mycobacterium methanotrophicum]